MKYTPDYSSRFRILKGGKISLVVSALLVSSSMVGPSANAADLVAGVTTLTENTTLTTTEALTTSADQMTVDIDADNFDVNVNINHDITNTTTSGTPSAVRITDPGQTSSSVTIGANATLSTVYGSSVLQVSGTLTDFSFTNNGTVESTSEQTGFKKAININTSLSNGSTITNGETGTIKIDTTSAQTGYGIVVNNVNNGTISNAGLIDIKTANNAYGITSFADISNDSSVTNSGTIKTNATRALVAETENSLGTWTNVWSHGIMAWGDNSGVGLNNSSIENSNLIDANASLDVTINANQYGAFDTTARARGIIIGADWDTYSVNGTDADNLATITNSGTINATATLDAHFGEDGLELYGTHYERTFSAKANGIEAGDLSFAKIENSFGGTITSLAEVTVDPNGSVYYYGGRFAESSGIVVGDMTNHSEIYNIGAIDSTAIFTGSDGARARSFGINVNGVVSDSTVASFGTLTLSAQATADGRTDAIAKGIFINDSVSQSIIGNAGLMEVEATANTSANIMGNNAWAEADGIFFYDPVSGTMIVNAQEGDTEAKIKVTAAAESYYTLAESEAVGINLDDGFSESLIRNEGEIEVIATAESIESDAYADARGIFVYDFQDSEIINDADVTVTASADSYDYSDVDAYGMYILTNSSGEDSASLITNNGTISANAEATISTEEEGSIYTQSTGIYVSHSYDADFTLNNTGTITATINDELGKDGYSLYINSNYAERVNVTNSGTLRGNIDVDGSLTNNGTLSQKSNIELPHNAMDEENAYIQNFTNGQYGKLTIGLLTDGTMEGTTYSQLRTTNATFENGSTIAVNVLAASTNAGLLAGNRLENVVVASSALNIDGTLNIEEHSELLNFEYVTTSADGEDSWINGEDGAIHLDIVKASENNIVDSTIAGQGNNNAKSAASSLQAIQDAGVPAAMQAYFSALGELGTAAEVAAAVESTTPVAATAAVGTTTQIMNGVQGIVEMRQNTTMGTGMNSGDIALRDQNLWIKPFGSRGTQDNKDGMNGFDVKAYGFGMGYDAEIAPKQRFGAAFFYTDADVDVKGMSQNSDVKVYTGLVYGNMPINTNTDFLYQVGYSWQKTESERVILPTYDRATADFTAKTASLDLKLMQTYALNKEVVIRPRVETTYRHYTNPSYSESGAGGMNLEVDKFTSTQFITGAGMIAEYKMDKVSKLITDLRLGYDWHHDSQTVTASYQGAAGVDFTTNGIDNGGWQYDIGLGYETANLLGGEINFMYNYQGQGNSFDNHVLSAKYVWKF